MRSENVGNRQLFQAGYCVDGKHDICTAVDKASYEVSSSVRLFRPENVFVSPMLIKKTGDVYRQCVTNYNNVVQQNEDTYSCDHSYYGRIQ